MKKGVIKTLLTKITTIKWCPQIKKYYESKGYKWTKQGDIFKVKVEDLTNSSHALVDIQCDECGKILKNIPWKNYKRYVHDDGKYYCNKCATKLYGGKNLSTALLLKNGKSFYDWCINYDRQDILNRWDYDLNNCSPDKVSYGTNKKYYFKCPKGIHPSELKNIHNFTNGKEYGVDCKMCNSFAQWGIDNICSDFLEKYWSKKNTINPWKISYGSEKKIYIKCQDSDCYHIYKIACCDFVSGGRCPKCRKSKGEKRIEEYLIKNKFIQIEDTNQIININQKYYIPQKEFDGLIGLGNGNLSYDFYLPQYNLLIEYQGEMHERYVRGIHKSKRDFEKQVEHDKRKRAYTEDNKIKLLEIWYWDFNNVGMILQKVIN